MLSITRLRYDDPESAEEFQVQLRGVRELLRASAGCAYAEIGRNLDDPTLWVLQSRWEGPGAWRRALSATSLKVAYAELGRYVLEEPSAYELLGEQGEGNVSRPRSLG